MSSGFNFGQFSYPGIVSYETVSVTDLSGISPSIITVRCFPQAGWPSPEGNAVFTYNDQTIVFQNCKVDVATVERDSGGRIVLVRILDSRWRWGYGQINLRANVRLPNNFVNPLTEKTPQQIATLCFQAMGEVNFDVSALPADARPDVDWEATNPAKVLAQMCDDLGCRIVPQRSTGAWIIRVTGEGNTLPDNLPYQDASDGFDPKELPDYLAVVTAPIAYQVALRLEPVGRDVDQSWRFPSKLSYCPNPNNTNSVAYGFGIEPQTMSKIDPKRVPQGDGSAISPRELARQFLYRSWRLRMNRRSKKVLGFDSVYINGYDDYVCRKQIILTDRLAQCWTDAYGEIHARPAYIFGEFESLITSGNNGNYPPGTRIDYQSEKFKDEYEERASFNLNPDPLDTDRSIITTSHQMRFLARVPQSNGSQQFMYDFAKLFYVCAINIRDPMTWQPVRYHKLRQISDNPNPDLSNVMTIVKNEIQPWYINLYNADGSWSSNTNNKNDVDTQCEYWLDAIQRGLETISTSQRTYIGLFQIDMDGAIQQVTYEIGKQGCSTIASYGCEHSWDNPPYAERRQRDGRHGILERVLLEKEIADRRIRTIGTFNTI